MELKPGKVKGVVCFLVFNNEVILAKKKHKIGAGLYNGYGGGIHDNETEHRAAVRELYEESMVIVRPEDLEHAALLRFHNELGNGSECLVIIDVFIARAWKGEPKETKEMGPPKRFFIDDLPVDDMMFADRLWLPQILGGHKIMGNIWYDREQRKLTRPPSLIVV